MATSPSPRSRPPAVAVMAKVPGVSPVKSRLHSVLTAARATELYRCFLLDRLDALAELGDVSPVVAFTPVDAAGRMKELAPAGFLLVAQRGSGLGERLSTLLRELLEDGHSGAIALDSDSPTLPMAYVAAAASVLGGERCDVVLGPCEDGGYYLIGLLSLQPDLFEGGPWSTDAVFSMTLEKASHRGLSVHVLPRWFDVDTKSDLRQLHADMAATSQGSTVPFDHASKPSEETCRMTLDTRPSDLASGLRRVVDDDDGQGHRSWPGEMAATKTRHVCRAR